MEIENRLASDLKMLNEVVYKRCGFDFFNFNENYESKEYGACTFLLNTKKIHYRFSKITPTKIGQFVTIWKRNIDGITEPYNVLDDFDLIIISSRSKEHFGQFIFPKSVLLENGILSTEAKSGKRGIRVYPPWEKPSNKQAIKTQQWQLNYFLTVNDKASVDLELALKLLNKI